MTGHRQDLTRSRVRLRMDFSRIAMSVSRPGIDPRTWVSYARVDDDPDAIVWDEELGWLVDATCVGGALEGEPVLCRTGSDGQGNGVGRYSPPRAGCLVLVSIPNGDVNDDCVILRQLHDAECLAPTTVNGDQIVERDASSGQVAAAETHLAVFPQEDKDEEWRAVRVTASGAHKVHGETVELGVDGADQPFVRGEDLRSAIDALADGIKAAFFALTNGGSTSAGGVPLTAAQAAYGATPLLGIQKAVQDVKDAADAYLSERISGD